VGPGINSWSRVRKEKKKKTNKKSGSPKLRTEQAKKKWRKKSRSKKREKIFHAFGKKEGENFSKEGEGTNKKNILDRGKNGVQLAPRNKPRAKITVG